LPGIVISQIGVENQNPGEGTNARDDVQYPVTITVLASGNQNLVTNQEKYLKWRRADKPGAEKSASDGGE
jgi:hypothetical protein